MEKLGSWLIILVAVLWLLPLVRVETGTWGPWLVVIAFAVIGIMGIIKK